MIAHCIGLVSSQVQRDFEDLPPSAPLSLRASLMVSSLVINLVIVACHAKNNS